MRKACMYDHTVEQIVHTRNKRLNLRRALTCLDPIQFRSSRRFAMTPYRGPARNDVLSLDFLEHDSAAWGFRNRMGRILAYSGEKTGVSKGKGDFLMNT